MINGNKDGIRDSVLSAMEGLYDIEIGADEFAPLSLLEPLCAFSAQVGREISVYIGRDGAVLDVTIGDSSTVALKNMRLRRNTQRLSGIRCLHTHPSGGATLSAIDIQSLQKMKFDAMAAVSFKPDGKPSAVSAAFLGEADSAGRHAVQAEGPLGVFQIPQKGWMDLILQSEKLVAAARSQTLHEEKERAVLVGVANGENDENIIELRRLLETAGGEVVGVVTQRLLKPDTATYIGKGKAQELALLIQGMECDLCVFDDELSGAQLRNLEEMLGIRVLDRTALILDIFAQRAHSREGKLQVELAQLAYRLPRLIGKGLQLSRMVGGGGIGMRGRGAGETKLQLDRRVIRSRIADIDAELRQVAKERDVRRARREKSGVPVVALVGYTNAGKSTLLNRLSDAGVLAEDKLFATLDPITRQVALPSGQEILLVDTVGFINKLPHDLVRAFKSTLEEAIHADMLLIIHDASNANAHNQARVVDEVLRELGANDKPRIDVLNKSDMPSPEGFTLSQAVRISALTGDGCDELLLAVQRHLEAKRMRFNSVIPYANGVARAFIHERGHIISESFVEEGASIDATLDPADHARLMQLLAAE